VLWLDVVGHAPLIFRAWGLVPVSRIRAPQIRSGLRPLCLERLFRFFRKELTIDFYANLEYKSTMVGCGGACAPFRVGVLCGW
jgi:hypothetical protein